MVEQELRRAIAEAFGAKHVIPLRRLRPVVSFYGVERVEKALRAEGVRYVDGDLVRPIERLILKGAALPVGTVRQWGRKRYRKISPSRWQEAREGEHGPHDRAPLTRKWTKTPPAGVPSPESGGTQKLHQNARGEYTRERKEIHDKLVSSRLAEGESVPAGAKPVAILMMGGSGSGKSSLLNKAGIGKNFVRVDADWVKEQLPEFHAGIKASYRGAAAAVHEESSDVAKRIKAETMAARKNMIFDGTGANADNYKKFIQELKSGGYEVHVWMADIPVSEGLRRARDRAERSGRWVPGKFIRSAYEKIPKNFFDVAAHADGAKLFDNRGSARLVYEKHVTGDEDHHDEKFLASFPNYPGKKGGSP